MATLDSRLYSPITDWSTRESHIDKRGYVRVLVPEHPKAFGRGWMYEHRLVMERHLGRVLDCLETVHHINEVKHDNRLVNLFVCPHDEHNKAHDLIFSFA